MSKKIFTKEEIDKLSKNKYVKGFRKRNHIHFELKEYLLKQTKNDKRKE